MMMMMIMMRIMTVVVVVVTRGAMINLLYRGVARIFKGGGGHTVSNIIVMAFSPRNIVGCLLKKGLQRGGHGHPRTPLSLRPLACCT